MYGQPAPTAPAASVEGKMIEELLRKLAADFDKTLTGQSILESDGTMPLIQPKSKARLSMSLTWRGRARPMPLPPLPQD